MSRRFLQLTGLDREEAERDTMKAFVCIHPDDLDDWIHKNAVAFSTKQNFYGQTRIIVGGEVRWITAESVPRELPDGSTVWEGVLIDVTKRVAAEQALSQAKEQVEEANRALTLSNDELNRLVSTDALTGTHNRRFLEAAIEEQLERLRRYAEPVTLLLFDVDHFKAVNDTYGHMAGDEALVEVARRVQQELRATDIFGRWGGDELVVVLPHIDVERARQVAEKLRQQVGDRPMDGIGHVTVSFGVAGFAATDTLDAIVRRADGALYAAKAAGRNRVCVAAD